jgi:Holliday junction resolvase RusA-like endonuclease
MMAGMTSPKYEIEFALLGEPASKANQRRAVLIGGSPRFIKSKKALAYLKEIEWQLPKMEPLLEGDLVVEMVVYYRTRRPDLDESLILDVLQGYIYENDRQVKEKHIYWGLDDAVPRTEVRIGRLDTDLVEGRIFESG